MCDFAIGYWNPFWVLLPTLADGWDNGFYFKGLMQRLEE